MHLIKREQNVYLVLSIDEYSHTTSTYSRSASSISQQAVSKINHLHLSGCTIPRTADADGGGFCWAAARSIERNLKGLGKKSGGKKAPLGDITQCKKKCSFMEPKGKRLAGSEVQSRY